MSPGEARWRASTCMRSTVPMRARPAQGCPKGCASLRKSACATRNGGASGKKFQASGTGADAGPVAVSLVPAALPTNASVAPFRAIGAASGSLFATLVAVLSRVSRVPPFTVTLVVFADEPAPANISSPPLTVVVPA